MTNLTPEQYIKLFTLSSRVKFLETHSHYDQKEVNYAWSQFREYYQSIGLDGLQAEQAAIYGWNNFDALVGVGND